MALGSKKDNMKEIQHKAIAKYNRGLFLVIGHVPGGSLLLIRYMSANK
jgi:hypothetical protein